MNAVTVIIALASIIIGYVSNAVQTGKFLNIVTVPTTWLPYLTIVGTFLTAFIHSLATATPPVTGETWFTAIVAGFMALTGTTVGVTIHQHINANKTTQPAKPTSNGDLKS